MSKKIEESVANGKVIVSVIVMIMLALWIFKPSKKTETKHYSSKTETEVQWDSEDYSLEFYVRAKEGITNLLASPSTADFPFGAAANVVKNGQLYSISSYVDSQNVYGGTVRTQYKLTARRNAYSWKITSCYLDGIKIK